MINFSSAHEIIYCDRKVDDQYGDIIYEWYIGNKTIHIEEFIEINQLHYTYHLIYDHNNKIYYTKISKEKCENLLNLIAFI